MNFGLGVNDVEVPALLGYSQQMRMLLGERESEDRGVKEHSPLGLELSEFVLLKGCFDWEIRGSYIFQKCLSKLLEIAF